MKTCFTILLALVAWSAQAQMKPRFDSLNKIRIQTNLGGMKVLAGWSAANIVAGAAGYFIAEGREAKAFHGMNAAWGLVNLGIAGLGYQGARKELRQQQSCSQQLSRYESNRRLYLINFGLDFAYIGGGLLLNSYAHRFNDPELFHGFGKSVALQGAFLLLFDGTMYALHQHRHQQWYKLLDGLCITGNGIGLQYRI